MTRAELQALRPGDVVEFRNWSAGGKIPYRSAVVVRISDNMALLRLENGSLIERSHNHLRKEGVKT